MQVEIFASGRVDPCWSPQAEDPPIRKHTTPAPRLCETVHAADLQGLAQPASQRPPRRDVTAAHPWSNSEHFRRCPRTYRPHGDILGARRTNRTARALAQSGGSTPYVRHETARVHHACRWRGGCVAARGAGTAVENWRADRRGGQAERGTGMTVKIATILVIVAAALFPGRVAAQYKQEFKMSVNPNRETSWGR